VTLEAPGEDFDFDAGERAPRATSRIRRRAPGRTGRHPSRSSASSRPSPNRPRKRWSWTSATPGIEWQRLSDVEMRSIVFADKPPLQTDAFHLLAGRKGMGKGTLLAEIGSRVTRGELGPKRNVIWIGSEDSAADRHQAADPRGRRRPRSHPDRR
jgi:hypothetical protein